VEVEVFLSSAAPHGGEWLVSRPGHYTFEGRPTPEQFS